MPYEIPVYRAEVECGVAPAIRAQSSVAYLVPAEPLAEADPAAPRFLRACAAVESAMAGQEDIDLFRLKDVLVSVAWNRNDDVFTRAETWAARHTSEDKPFNFEHDQSDIIGHIVATYAADDAMAPIADDTPVDDLPEKFHIVNGSVIYRNVGSKERRAFIERTIAEIGAGEWCVSMECFFRGFDYAVRKPDGSTHVVARDESTAWMTKYLRAYRPKDHVARAGDRTFSGTFLDEASGEEYAIGRVLRNITFSGKGLVRKPANPDSVIVAGVGGRGDSVYVGAGSDVRPAESPENTEMPESNAEVLGLQGQLAAAHETITSLQASLETLKAQNSEATIAALRADVAARDASVASLTVEVDGLKAQVATLTGASAAVVARAEAAEAALAAANERIAAEAAERTQAARVALAVKAGATAEAAATLVENLKGLADDAFASTLEVVKASFVAPAPKAAATPAAIDNARPEKDAALASSADVDGEARSAAIASFFESTVLRTPAGRSQASN